MTSINFNSYDSPIGHLLLIASDKGLREIFFDYEKNRLLKVSNEPDAVASEKPFAQVRGELDKYFAGKLRDFTVPLDLHGTDFQLRCWKGLLEIPYGQTCSYADLARKVGSPRGFRAVGMANHDNPIPIIVPCHRVITSDHKLGGYGGGLNVKEYLLKLEGAVWREPHPKLAFAAEV